MKKTILTIASVFLVGAFTFGQTPQQVPASTAVHLSNQRSVNGNIQTNEHEVHSLNNEHHCKTFELNQAHYAERGLLDEFNAQALLGAKNADGSGLNKTPGVNTISIIFHVVHNPNNPAENVSYGDIMDVYNDLSEDYLLQNANAANARGGFTPFNAGINFCLATQMPDGTPLTEPGVIRVSTNEGWYDSDNNEENKMKTAAGGSQIWDRNDYLNVWICDITNGANSGTAGYAYRPTSGFLPSSAIDGIVIDYNLGVNNENVLTHEVGHYLGLDHTWGGSGGCTADDGYSDTPQTAGPSFNYAGSCSGSQQTCSGIETQYENYMDYSNCTVMFTEDQGNHMLSILQGIRASLLLSPGCDPVDAPPVVDFTADIADPIIIPVGGTVNFFSLATNAPTSWTWDFNGGATNSTNENPNVTFGTAGTYTVTHTATNAFGTGSETKTNHVQVVTAASGGACDTLRNYDPTDGFYYTGPNNGYIMGNVDVGALGTEWAERYTTPSTTQVRAVEFLTQAINDGGGNVTFKVYADDNGGLPGTVQTTEVVPLADLSALTWENIEFSTPVDVTGNFWVGYEVSYNATDTFALLGAFDGTLTQNHNYVNLDGGFGWMETSALYAAPEPNTAFILDVLTSNGTAPTMDFTATNDQACINGEITVNGSASTDNNNYAWYLTDDPITTIIETNNTAGTTFTLPSAGDHLILLQGGGACITDIVALPVTVFDEVDATVNSSATTCGSNDGTITVSSPTGGDGVDYFYSLDGVNYQTTTSFSNLASGDYTIYVATSGDNCEAQIPVTVATSSPFVATINANTAICPGNSATLTAGGGNTYVWSDGSNTIANIASTSVSPSNTTQYECLVTDGSGCQSLVQTTVTVNPVPAAPSITNSGANTICSGNSVTLSSSYSTSNDWSTGSTSNSITASSAGTYTVTHTDGNGCESAAASITISVSASPTITTGAITSPSNCGTSTGSIQVNGTGTGNVSWNGSATGNANGVSLPYTVSGLAAGTYNVTFTNGTGCVSNQLSESISDPNAPTTPVIISGGATTFCQGGSVVLNSSESGNLLWSNGETTQSITVSTGGNYSVTITDGSGCSASSTTVIVAVNANPTTPTISAGGPTTICSNESVSLTASQATGLVWSNNETTQTVSVNTAGNYSVTYTDANGCNATSASTMVTVNTAPTVAFADLGMLCDYNDPITLSTGTPAGGNYTGTGVTTSEFNPASAGLGTHTITYTYTDGNGCTNSDNASIEVDACLSIEENNGDVFNVIPNPIDNEVKIISTGDFNYTVIDGNGRVITTGNGNEEVQLDSSKFESGIYFVTVTNSNNTNTKKIIKK